MCLPPQRGYLPRPREVPCRQPALGLPQVRGEGTPLRQRPGLSWLLLRGRCRDCRAPISPRYPAVAVEALMALLFVGVWWRFGASWTAAIEAARPCLWLGDLGFIDFDHMVLPRRVVYADLAVVVALSVAWSTAGNPLGRLGVAVLCAVHTVGALFCHQLLRPARARLRRRPPGAAHRLRARLARAGVRILGLPGSELARIGRGLALVAAGKAGRRSAVPFGTFLAAGAVLAMLAGQPLVSWYTGLVR